MPPTETGWVRASREMPCPICERPDWCSVSADKTVCVCMRTESGKPTRNGGFLHRLTDTPRPRQPRHVIIPPRVPPPDLTQLAADFEAAATADRLAVLAAELGLSATSLAAYGVGWSSRHAAWSFPMRDPATGKVTGIRLRTPGGKKFSVSGGKEALFTPDTFVATDEILLVLEGATDAIAAHGIGFPNAVGRPSCTGGTDHVVALVRSHKPACVVIVRDNDEPGARGAEALATTLSLYSRDVRLIAPPDGVKDLRGWVATGATRPDLEHCIRAAAVRRLDFADDTKGTK